MELLKIVNLQISYDTPRGIVHAVDDVSFVLKQGENLGLVGESGCGKTTMGKSILRILPANSRILGGQINFQGSNLLTLSNSEMNEIRWKQISMISQSAMNALNPVYRIGDQLLELLKIRGGLKNNEARDRAFKLFELVGLDRKRFRDFPHLFSGGMKQRVVIAMALALNPSLIIADEPTTALDVIIQDQVLRRIYEIQKTLGKSLILITHDIAIVAERCDKIAVMYAGKLLEFGDIQTVFGAPCSPYTIGLKNAFPSLTGEKKDLISIPGSPPNLINPSQGCRFYGRCPFSIDLCFDAEPELIRISDSHFAACHRIEEIDDLREKGLQKEIWQKGIKKSA